jgi:hypothetical protein
MRGLIDTLAGAWKIVDGAAFSLHKGGGCDKITVF